MARDITAMQSHERGLCSHGGHAELPRSVPEGVRDLEETDVGGHDKFESVPSVKSVARSCAEGLRHIPGQLPEELRDRHEAEGRPTLPGSLGTARSGTCIHISLSLYIYIYIYIEREREKERERDSIAG